MNKIQDLESPEKYLEILNRSILLDYNDLVNINDVSKILGTSKWFCYEEIKKGNLPCVAIGKEYKVLKLELIRYIVKNSNKKEVKNV